MKRKDWLLGFAVLACLLAIAWYLWPRASISYADLMEARTGIEAEGFFCTSDRTDGKICTGFMVTREPATADEANLLPRGGPMGPEWDGKIWVRKCTGATYWTMPDNVEHRIWGGVCVFGDKDFLAEIEAALLRGRVSQM
jgi:hypothetical protein